MTKRTTKTKTEPSAQDAFVEHCLRIDAALARLDALREDHFGAEPDRLNWGDAGAVAQIADLIERAADFAEGQC